MGSGSLFYENKKKSEITATAIESLRKKEERENWSLKTDTKLDKVKKNNGRDEIIVLEFIPKSFMKTKMANAIRII